MDHSLEPLKLSGTVVDEKGAAVLNAKVYFHKDELSVATTDLLGHFQFTISRDILDERLSVEKDIFGDRGNSYNYGFYLQVFDKTEKLSGVVSRKILFQEEGTKDLGKLVLTNLAKIAGNASKFRESRSLAALPRADVILGHKRAKTNELGYFEIEGVPRGLQEVQVFSEDSLANRVDVVLDQESLLLTFPLVVFPQDIVNGVISVLDSEVDGSTGQGGHPYVRVFKSMQSSRAEYIRFSHDRDKLEKAEWIEVNSEFSYTFDNEGDAVLFAQFADVDQSELSDVLSLPLRVGDFDLDDVLVIGDGSGVINSLGVDIHINPPPGATKMRLATNEEDLTIEDGGSVERPIETLIHYVFMRPETARITLFCQFGFDDARSLVVEKSVVFVPFPLETSSVFTIEDGADASPYRVVRLNIDVPPNAVEMRVNEVGANATASSSSYSSYNSFSSNSSSSVSANGWIAVSPIHFHLFSTPGMKELFVTFRDIDKNESPTYHGLIRILPFEPSEIGFDINSGQIKSSSKDVDIFLLPPYSALSFRIWQEGSTPSSDWATIIPKFKYSLSKTGWNSVKVQYKNIDDDVSLVYTNGIEVDLFAEEKGNFTINNGDSITSDPLLRLSIIAPFQATEMIIAQGKFPDIENENEWLSLSSQHVVKVANKGIKDVYLRFRNAAREVSPMLHKTIIYDPFPAGSGGFSINDGLSVTDNPLLNIVLDPPLAAFAFSINSDLAELSEFLSLQSPVKYLLPEKSGFYNIYMKFKSEEGEESLVYSRPIELQLFPDVNLVAVLNNGASTTTTTSISIALNPPYIASGIRISENISDLNSSGIRSLNGALMFELSSGLGTKTLYFQYISANETTSPVFSSSIDLQ
ncbi:MAG: hypothetical protein R3B45_09440 [Bdellovibrionota bacterium]